MTVPTLLLATSAALAAATPDDAVYDAVDKLYGKEIPEEAVCILRPTLPPPLGALVPVGVRRGARGCVLVGVMTDGALVEREAALATVVDDDAWAELDEEQRASTLRAWTTDVLLAFGQPRGEATVTAGPDAHVVQATWLHRTDDSDVAGRSTGSFTFDAGRVLVAEEDALQERWRTTFGVRGDKVEGVSSNTVLQALQSKGRTLKRCFLDAWERDLQLEGRVRLQWTLQGGKATQMGVLAGDEHPEELAKCYARVVRSVAFPEDAVGTVRWSFSAVQTPVD